MRNVRRRRSREPTGQQLESGVNPWWGLGLVCVCVMECNGPCFQEKGFLPPSTDEAGRWTHFYIFIGFCARKVEGWSEGEKKKEERKEPLYFYPSFFSRSVLIEGRMEEKTQRGKARKKRRTSRRKRKMKKGLENEARKLSYSQIQVQEWITQIVFSPTSLFLLSSSIQSQSFLFLSLFPR